LSAAARAPERLELLRLRGFPSRRSRRLVAAIWEDAACADLVDPGLVNIFERWESQAARETFRRSGPDTEQRPRLDPRLGAVITRKTTTRERTNP
jgi:hypothetical protein